ncbi:hypothetical protein [Flavobacterium sp. ASW18X]|uniref:hypothetical protein n=1 Tax=Flavobacterium sp. ASW18X TaxID=2572595 RepID=UPI0010AE7D2B|nr:hypothetical protein [Flavobacterium sp. ASW18X]TKD66155.1 hypothetical protein FBT53_04595 [Flavobacterium sp. ASW18X]
MKAKQIFTYVLLFTLFTFKVSSFHVFSHTDNEDTEIENCLLCEVALTDQQEVFFVPSSLEIETLAVSITFTSLSIKPAKAFSSFYFYKHTSRPPPKSLV